MSTSAVERRIAESVEVSEINLEGMAITSVEVLLPLLGRMPLLRSLRLARNMIQHLPSDLATLGNLESLDISENPIAGLPSILAGLASLENLRHLSVNLPTLEEEENLIVALPDLRSLNGTALDDSVLGQIPATEHGNGVNHRADSGPAGEEYRSQRSWEASDSQCISDLYSRAMALDRDTSDAAGIAEFNDYVDRVVAHVKSLEAVEGNHHVREGEVLKAHQLLFMYCFEEAARSVAQCDEQVGARVQPLLQYSAKLLEHYDQHWRCMRREHEERVCAVQEDLRVAVSGLEAFLSQPHGEPTPVPHSGTPQARHSPSAPRDPAGRVTISGRPSAATGTSTTVPNAVVHATPSQGRRPAVPVEWSRPRGRSNSPPRGTKVLSIKQLRHQIEEVYSSKIRYDAKCHELHLPRETMEQHMYSFLNQRYGLRELILEYASAIVEGIQRFATEDNDVAVFGYILRNEIDEEFRHVQRRVRETVRELLRLDIRARRPRRSDTEVDQLLQRKMAGTLSEDEWGEIVKYMYNAEDAASIIEVAQSTLYQQFLATRYRGGSGGSVSSAPSKSQWQLAYADLVNILLSFQLEGHRRFLAPYVTIFRQHDTDRNGIVNDVEFKAIVRAMDPHKSESEASVMVSAIDQSGGRLITFSESVGAISDMIPLLSRGRK